MNFDAKTTGERLERLEKVLGISYEKKGNIARVNYCFGGMEKED
jgi:hypothetical protein